MDFPYHKYLSSNDTHIIIHVIKGNKSNTVKYKL
jgi:hypothetical protein